MANHIAIYPFIDFSFAKNSIKPMSKREKKKLMEKEIMPQMNKGGKFIFEKSIIRPDGLSDSSCPFYQ